MTSSRTSLALPGPVSSRLPASRASSGLDRVGDVAVAAGLERLARSDGDADLEVGDRSAQAVGDPVEPAGGGVVEVRLAVDAGQQPLGAEGVQPLVEATAVGAEVGVAGVPEGEHGEADAVQRAGVGGVERAPERRRRCRAASPAPNVLVHDEHVGAGASRRGRRRRPSGARRARSRRRRGARRATSATCSALPVCDAHRTVTDACSACRGDARAIGRRRRWSTSRRASRRSTAATSGGNGAPVRERRGRRAPGTRRRRRGNRRGSAAGCRRTPAVTTSRAGRASPAAQARGRARVGGRGPWSATPRRP